MVHYEDSLGGVPGGEGVPAVGELGGRREWSYSGMLIKLRVLPFATSRQSENKTQEVTTRAQTLHPPVTSQKEARAA